MASDSRLDALRALTDTALRLARGTTSAQLGLAGLHGLVDPAGLPDAIRPDVMAVLDDAAADVRPLGVREVERALRDAWGEPPARVLDAFDADPVAVTPAAQVHRGEHDGAAVAVKVLRPGLSDAVRGDLVLADTLVRPLGAAFPGIDPGALVREARERVLDELDLEHEASVQRGFARALRRHATLHVPLPVSDLCHERVLVSAWVDGVPVRALTDPAQREEAARGLIAFHVGGVRFGTVHADPHPDNALRLADGRLAVVDFGAVRQVPAARVDLAVAALDAFAAGDAPAFSAALDALGWLDAQHGADALALARAIVGDLVGAGPRVLDAAALRALADRAWAQREPGLRLAVRGRVAPEDLWPLRMVGQLVAVLGRLGVEADWLPLIREAARDGW